MLLYVHCLAKDPHLDLTKQIDESLPLDNYCSD